MQKGRSWYYHDRPFCFPSFPFSTTIRHSIEKPPAFQCKGNGFPMQSHRHSNAKPKALFLCQQNV